MKIRHHTLHSSAFEPYGFPPDMVDDLPTDARAALTGFCEAVVVVYGLQTWERIRYGLRDPEHVQDPIVSRPDLLFTAEHHSPLLYADTKIRAVIGSEPRT